MTKLKLLLVWLLFVVAYSSFSQVIVKDSSVLQLYDGKHQAKAYSYKEYKISSIKKLKYPVDLKDLTQYLIAEISTDSLLFYRTLYLNPEKDAIYTQEHLNIRASYPRDVWYYKVLFKLDVKIDSMEYTFLKIHKYKKGKISTNATSYILKNSRYYYYIDQITNKYNSILFVLKQEYLEDVFIKHSSAEPILNKLITDNYKDGALNLEKLVTELNDLAITNKTEMIKFIDPYIY